MVRHAARLVRNGDLGRIRFAAVEHASGWAATPLELGGHKQARWRTDPDIAGFPSVVADLGTHAFHLLRYITGLEATRVSAELSTLVPGRRVFDNASVRLTLSNGAPATLWASMAATGSEHGLRIRVFGDIASLEWRHEDPHHLAVRDLDGGTTILAQGMSSLSEDADPPHPTRPGTSGRVSGGIRELLPGPGGPVAGAPRRNPDARTRSVHPHRRRRPDRRPVRRGGGGLARRRRRLGGSRFRGRESRCLTCSRFALIGAGFIGGVHAANLAAHPDVDFALIYDIDPARAEMLAQRHNSRATTDLGEVFDPEAIDAVFIASSTDTHAEHLRSAAGGGHPGAV